MIKVHPISFQSKFIKQDKFKGKTAEFVHEVINKKVDNVSNKELLEQLPFDVEICRKNKSHKAIHPEVAFYIDYQKFWGKQVYYVEHGVDYTIGKMREWFKSFSDYVEKNKDRRKLTRKEEHDNIFNFINGYGQIRHYKPLQRH